MNFYSGDMRAASAIQAALCDCAGQRIRALLTTQAEMVTALYPHNEWKEKALPAAEGRRAFLDRHLKGNKENHELIVPKTKALIEAIDKVTPLCKVFQCTSIIEEIKQIDLDARAYVSACGAITISVYQYEKLGPKYSKADLKMDAEKFVKGLQKHKAVIPDEILVSLQIGLVWTLPSWSVQLPRSPRGQSSYLSVVVVRALLLLAVL